MSVKVCLHFSELLQFEDFFFFFFFLTKNSMLTSRRNKGKFSTEDKKSFFFQRGFYCTQFTKEIKTFYHRAAAAKVSLLFCNTKDYVAQRKLS